MYNLWICCKKSYLDEAYSWKFIGENPPNHFMRTDRPHVLGRWSRQKNFQKITPESSPVRRCTTPFTPVQPSSLEGHYDTNHKCFSFPPLLRRTSIVPLIVQPSFRRASTFAHKCWALFYGGLYVIHKYSVPFYRGPFYEEPLHYPQMLSSLLRSATSLPTSVQPSTTEAFTHILPNVFIPVPRRPLLHLQSSAIFWSRQLPGMRSAL